MKLTHRLATAAGHAVRLASRAVRTVPGVGGVACVSGGVALYEPRAGLIVLGLFLLALGREIQ